MGGQVRALKNSSTQRPDRRARRLGAGALLATLAAGAALAGSIVLDHRAGDAIADSRAAIEAATTLRSAVTEAETAVRGYVLGGGPEYLAPYEAALRTQAGATREIGPRIDAWAAAQPAGPARARSLAGPLGTLQAGWKTSIRLTGDYQRQQAASLLTAPDLHAAMDQLTGTVDGFTQAETAALAEMARRFDALRLLLQAGGLACFVLALGAILAIRRRTIRATIASARSRLEGERLFTMLDMLQSATRQRDADAVLRAIAVDLLPGFDGTLYLREPATDRFAVSLRWGGEITSDSQPADAARVEECGCWALKRGKPHINRLSEGSLRCAHVAPGRVNLELPMMAGGELFGLLELGTGGRDAAGRLADILPLGAAIADAMALALSALALRERLRVQAFRDPLTGLYNRRYLDDELPALCEAACALGNPVSVALIDLDRFRKLNDEHGHAAADDVLRNVAQAVASCLREGELGVRFGGEEFLVVLPEATAAQAATRAEQIRARVAELTGPRGGAVTVSIGVVTLPESASTSTDLIAHAEAALIRAKAGGRNRVIAADPIRRPAAAPALIGPDPV